MSELLVEQRSDAWFEARKGKVTSSEIHKIMGSKKGDEALTETAKTYLLEKVAEFFGGAPHLSVPDGAKPKALEWGIELEETAISVYTERRGILVEKASFIPFSDYYGGSPDGLVPQTGVIEVKCPFNSANHFKHGMIKTDAEFKKIAPNYYWQCISNMVCAKAEWCDFISFDPRVHDEYQLFVYRLNWNQEEVDYLHKRLEVAVKYMEELKEMIQSTRVTA
jgi:hypothetical protein